MALVTKVLGPPPFFWLFRRRVRRSTPADLSLTVTLIKELNLSACE